LALPAGKTVGSAAAPMPNSASSSRVALTGGSRISPYRFARINRFCSVMVGTKYIAERSKKDYEPLGNTFGGMRPVLGH
jgi:hypothetical protein